MTRPESKWGPVTGPAVALAAALGFAGVPAAAQDFANARLTTVPVSEGLYMLMGPGGNIGVSIGADGVFIIDDQFAPMAEKVTAAIAELSDEPVRMVFNTHWHGDHTGGNEFFGESGALILAHDNVRDRMSKPFYSEFFDSETPPSPDVALPVVTFDSRLTLHLNGQTISGMHVPPAHTDGDTILRFDPANVVHMGDTYFNGFYPFIDTGSGGSIDGMIGAVNMALERMDANTIVIPGHGPLSDRAGLVEFRDMLVTVADRIRAMIDEGLDAEAIVAAKPTAEFDARWGEGFIKPDRWVRLVHGGMVRER